MSSQTASPDSNPPPHRPPTRSWARRVARIAVRTALVLVLAALASVATLRFVLWPQANVSRAWLERELSERLQIQLGIGALETYWEGWRPAFRVRALQGTGAEKQNVLSADTVEGTLSWRSLAHFSLQFESLRIDQANVLVRRDAEDRLHVAGVPVSPGPAADSNPTLGWLLQQGHVDIKNAKVRWRDEYAGQPTLEIGDITLTTSRRTLYHTIRLHARAQPLSPAPISLTADFRSALLGSAGDWRTWHGQGTWDVQGLRAAALVRYFPTALRPDILRTGSLTSSGSTEFKDGVIMRSQMRMRVQDLDMQWRENTLPIHLQSGQAFLVHQRNNKGEHSVRLDHLLWRATHEDGVPARRTDPATLAEQAELLPPRNGLRNVTFGWALANDQTFRQLSLKASEIDLDAIRNLIIRLPVTTGTLDTMRRLQLGGRVENLDVTWRRERPRGHGSDDLGVRYTARGALRNVRFDALPPPRVTGARLTEAQRTPGAAGLTGHFDATERGGAATIDSQQLTLTLPGVFDQPLLALDSLRGRLQWQWRNDELEIESERMQFANADAAGSARGVWRSSGKSAAGTLDLKGQLDHAQVRQVPRYLPSAISAEVRTYLAGALLAGQARGVQFVARGDLSDFPFANPQQGEFHVRVPVDGLTFQTAPAELRGGAPAWPAFENGSGEVIFERRGMHFKVDRANVAGIAGVSVTQVEGRIDDMDADNAALQLTGLANGPVQGFIQYVNRSPLGEWSGDVTAQSRATGTGHLTLTLNLPLEHVDRTKANGKLRITESDLTLFPDLPTFARTNGTLLITERGLSLDNMRTVFAGGEMRPEGGTQADGSTRFTAKGLLTARGLQAVRNDALGPIGNRLNGSTPYSAVVSVHNEQLAVTVDSTLEGLAIDLPMPLGKSSAEALPMRVELQPGKDGTEVLTAQLGRSLQARYDLQRNGDTMKVIRGGIGVNQPPPTPTSGVHANIQFPELDLDTWRELSATLLETNASGVGLGDDYIPSRIQLRANSARLFDRRIDELAVVATHDRDWRVQLQSKQIEGSAIWNAATPQKTDGKLTLRLKRLQIPEVPEEELVTEAFARRAEQLPSLDLVSNTLEIGGKSLGKLTVLARSEKQDGHPVWTLDRLALEQPAASFEARGSWRIPRRLRSEPDPERRTILSFTLALRDAGALLDRLGMQRMVRGGDGKLEGRLAWQGSPMAIDYPTLTGRLHLDVKDGVLLNVEPGAARLLGILSLQGLARLVTLDFRGVAASGTVFDATTASAEVRNGIATTNDFRMRSPQFTMEMKGSTNIPAETQQLEVTVLPKINATTASLATTFINPAIGLGTLAAQLLFADQVSSAFRQEYRISGSWSAPDIRKVGDNNATNDTADHRQNVPASH